MREKKQQAGTLQEEIARQGKYWKKNQIWTLALAAVALAMVCSCIVRLLPALDRISIVLCTVAAAGVCAALFPIPEEEESV